MDDPSTGLVQTPQYFRVSKDQTWVERAAGATLEVFYRVVQVSRDRFGSALCVGSNAVYRRAALDAAGGFTEIPYAEDSHTGLDLRYAGYDLVYLPIVLAAGVCPAAIDAFMRQQYRWCCGATSLIWTSHMWRVPMSWKARLPYVAGWLWNFTAGLRTLVLPLMPISLLVFLPGEVRLRNSLPLVPVILTGVLLYPLWHNSRWSAHAWPLAIAVGWAQVLAIWDFAWGRVMSWDPSRSPKDASRRFRKAVSTWNGTLGCRLGPARRVAHGADRVRPVRHRRRCWACSIWRPWPGSCFRGGTPREPPLSAIRVASDRWHGHTRSLLVRNKCKRTVFMVRSSRVRNEAPPGVGPGGHADGTGRTAGHRYLGRTAHPARRSRQQADGGPGHPGGHRQDGPAARRPAARCTPARQAPAGRRRRCRRDGPAGTHGGR